MLASKILRFLLWTLTTLALFLLVARLSLPFAIQSGFSYWFEQQGIKASIDDVALDIFDGKLLATGFKGEQQNSEVFSLSSLSLNWSWTELQENHLRIVDAKLRGLRIKAIKQSADVMVVAGINPAELASNEPAAPTKAAQTTPWKVTLDSLTLKTANLCYADKTRSNLDYCSQFNELTWRGDLAFDLARLTPGVTPLFAKGDLQLNDWLVHSNYLRRNLLDLASTSLNDISINTLSDINIAKISLDSLQLMQRPNDKLAPEISGLSKLAIDGFHFKQSPQHSSSLHVAVINIQDHELLLLKNKAKQWELNEWLPGNAVAVTSDLETAEGSFQFAVDQFIYASKNSLDYIDQSLAEPFNVSFKNTQIKIANIDSSKPNQESAVSYSTQYADHGQIQLTGTATPLAAKPSFAIDADFKGLDLRDVSTFTKDTIGHSISSGQLDATLKLSADNSILDSVVDLSLYQFQLKALSKADTEKLDSTMGFPLGPALSLLRDRDDSIHLSIPITGDLQNPNFAANQVVKKAIAKAMSLAVIGYFTPFGLVPVADKLFSLATTLRFDPIRFAPASHVTDALAAKNLAKIAMLMQQRPKIRLSLCSFTNSADRSLLLPETKNTAGTNAESLQLNKAQRLKLAVLANQRSSASKQHLVDKGVDPARLILCEAEHIEGNGLAGVEVRI